MFWPEHCGLQNCSERGANSQIISVVPQQQQIVLCIFTVFYWATGTREDYSLSCDVIYNNKNTIKNTFEVVYTGLINVQPPQHLCKTTQCHVVSFQLSTHITDFTQRSQCEACVSWVCTFHLFAFLGDKPGYRPADIGPSLVHYFVVEKCVLWQC